MKTIIEYKKLSLLSVFIFITFWMSATNLLKDTSQVVSLLDSKMLKEAKISDNLISSVAVTSDDYVLLATSNSFFALGWGSITPLQKNIKGVIKAFDFTARKQLLIVRNSELCYVDKNGKLVVLYKLASDDMGITSGSTAVYLYDRNEKAAKHAIYMLLNGNKFAKLIEMDAPINSLAEVGDVIFFSCKNTLYYLNLQTKKLKILGALPDANSRIISIEKDNELKTVFFSDNKSIYAFKDTAIYCISNKLGGVLKSYSRGLIVFNPEKQQMIAFLNHKYVPKKDVSRQTSVSAPVKLTNASIIGFVLQKVEDENIIKTIEMATDVQFDTSVDGMVDLSNHGVSSDVILAMKKAMKKKNSK